MKPFDLKLAEIGHPVCTRLGWDARIVCFDFNQMNNKLLAVYIGLDGIDHVKKYRIDGTCKSGSEYDLMMKDKEDML